MGAAGFACLEGAFAFSCKEGGAGGGVECKLISGLPPQSPGLSSSGPITRREAEGGPKGHQL